MDLNDLRSYIEAQKMLLQQERQILISQRIALCEQNTPQDCELSNPSTEELVSNTTTFASQVSDALCQRISTLNTFKDQVLQKSNEEIDPEPSSKQAEIIIKDLTSSENFSQEPEKPYHLNDNFEHKDENPNTADKKNSETKNAPLKESPRLVTVENISKPVKIIKNQTTFPVSRSREEEVERLQEKFASAPFWNDFGRSATAKKWSFDTLDTMVRIGEFSPANPDLQTPGRALLGLGEYEERRRQLLEKKKQEYKEYLSQNRNFLQRTDHLIHPSMKTHFDGLGAPTEHAPKGVSFLPCISAVDAATQTDGFLIEQTQRNISSLAIPESQFSQTSMLGENSLQPLSPRVPRAHASQTTEQLPDARMRQLQLQEELRLQIEEKRRMEAERREQERMEEEALQKRVAEQQARLQAEYERDERLRREREIQKQQQIEEFQRRQEELRAESEALKREERRQKLEAAENCCQKQTNHPTLETSKTSRNAHLVPPQEPAPLSILKSSSPPLRSPRRMAGISKHLDQEPPSPRALIKVLEGPTFSNQGPFLEDSLPIPLMPAAHNHALSLPIQRSPHESPRISPHQSPQRSPNRSPNQSPFRSPSRFVVNPNDPMPSHLHHHSSVRQPSEAMRNLEERWKVPAVQKNVCVRGKNNVQNSSGNVLTQLGAFRRQLQLEHMRMEEKVREGHQPNQYHQKYYQQPVPQKGHHY